jgi:DNA-binding transcriptional MerR regulator
MNISELARRAGTTPKAVRFYEAEGFMPPAARATNGYREYDEADLCRLRLVVALRSLGLSLPDSGRLADLCCTEGRCDDMQAELLPLVRERRATVAATRNELAHLDAELASLESALTSGSPRAGSCIGKEVSAE